MNAASFFQTRKDALVRVQDPGIFINTLGVNAGEININGFELEVQVLPMQGLNVGITLGYLDSEFEEYESFGTDFAGNRTPVTFKYTFSSVVSYTYPMSNGVDLFTFASYYTARDGFLAPQNINKMDEPETLDWRVGVKTDEWKLSAYVDNVLDDRYISFERDPEVEAIHFGSFAPGRTYGLQATYNF